MKLFYSATSPYVRKVMVTAIEKGLDGQIEKLAAAASPVNPDMTLSAKNPLGKVPCLITDDGEALFDSPVICAYLDQLMGASLRPTDAKGRFADMTLEALADGFLDAGILLRYEGALRPQEKQWDDWVNGLERALDALELLPADVRMSINVSPRVALDDRLCEALSARGAARVTLEVTEHDAVDDYDTVVAGLDRLRALGVHVAVDDAGSGYASLSHILRLRPDVLKIDRVITTGVDADPVRQAVAASLVRLGGSMGALVVAEGIETEREARALVDLGVTHGQGWLLGRPVPAAELDLSTRWHV